MPQVIHKNKYSWLETRGVAQAKDIKLIMSYLYYLEGRGVTTKFTISNLLCPSLPVFPRG